MVNLVTSLLCASQTQELFMWPLSSPEITTKCVCVCQHVSISKRGGRNLLKVYLL